MTAGFTVQLSQQRQPGRRYKLEETVKGLNVEHLEQLIVDMKESLEREIHALDRNVSSRIDSLDSKMSALLIRFDDQAARLDRQGALIQAGSRWTNRMNHWAEKIDTAMDKKDVQIAELRDRIERLEKNGGSGTAR